MQWIRRFRKFLFEPYFTEMYGEFKDESGFTFKLGKSYSRFDILLGFIRKTAFRALVIALVLAALGLIHTAMQLIR